MALCRRVEEQGRGALFGLGQGYIFKQVCSDDTLTEAWRKVRIGTYIAGIDSVTVEYFKAWLFANLKTLPSCAESSAVQDGNGQHGYVSGLHTTKISCRYPQDRRILAHMSTANKTLKLPFFRLNHAKADEFTRLQMLNTAVANAILALPRAERHMLTSKSFAHIEIGSAWINQTIRNANARTKVKQFRCLPLETNNQNWTLHKVGDTYSVSFGLCRGIKKRVPLAVHHAAHQRWLDAVLDGRASPGSLKLWCSRKGIWYACLSVSMDVPDTEPTGRWLGIDRGQTVPLAAATPDGPVIFWKANHICHIRRVYAARRKKLQAAGKQRAVKKLERRERRMVMHINHCLSKEVVQLAQRCNTGIRLEDLSGIRQRSKQRQTTKTDAGQNRDYWPFFQLEQFITYKAHLVGVAVEKVPAAYTSKSCHRCGALGSARSTALPVRVVATTHTLMPTRHRISATGTACVVRWFLRLQRTGHMACP